MGNFQLKATVTFQNYPMPTTYSGSYTINVAVNPPDTAELDRTCLSKPTPLLAPNSPPNLYVKFLIKRGTRQIYVQGTIKEKITRTPYKKSPDFDWMTAPYLSCTGPGEITDRKSVVIDPSEQGNWNAMPQGYIADEFDQSLEITLPTGCGTNKDYVLSPSFHFQMQKFDNSSWVLVLM